MGLLELVRKIPVELITPIQVKQELDAGVKAGHHTEFPHWLEVGTLSSELNPMLFGRLDSGEAAVIQLAIETKCKTVCLDESKGRRVAKEMGLAVTGSLGILGKAKAFGLIQSIRPLVANAVDSGIFYDDRLLENFLKEIGE